MRRPALLGLAIAALCGVILAAAESDDTGADFLQSVIGRIGGRPDAQPQDLARPVADLKAALERVSASMAAAGMDVVPASAAASQHMETVVLPGDGTLDGPPFVLAPTPEAPVASGSGVHPAFGPPPPLQAPPLSKDELAAVYQAVANKGVQLDLGSVKGGYLPGADGAPVQQLLGPGAAAAGDQAGYYYYFFPIKDLGDGKTAQQQMQQLQQIQQLGGGPTAGGDQDPGAGGDRETALGIMAQLTGDPGAMMGGADAQKSVEPLFMAMSGFIGMALMFIMSVLFLPKWGALRSRGVTALKHAPDELASLTKLVVQSIEGKDCSERIACEVGRAVRTMHLGNKPLRVLEIVLPPHLSKQIGHIRRAVRKAEKCSFIPCKYPAWWSGTAKPPLNSNVIKNKLPPKLIPPPHHYATTSPRPSAAARSTPRSKPLPHSRPPPPPPPPKPKPKVAPGKNGNNQGKPKPARPAGQNPVKKQQGKPSAGAR